MLLHKKSSDIYSLLSVCGPLVLSIFFFFNDPFSLLLNSSPFSPASPPSSKASCTCLSSHAAGTSWACVPMCPSTGLLDCLCLRPLRPARGSPRRSPAAGTSSQVWSWDTCKPRLWLGPTGTGRRGECGSRPACKRKWCWRWTSTTRRLCPPSGCAPGQLQRKVEEIKHYCFMLSHSTVISCQLLEKSVDH